MRKNPKFFKELALAKLKGNWNNLVLATLPLLILVSINMGLDLYEGAGFETAGLLITIAIWVVVTWYQLATLDFYRGTEGYLRIDNKGDLVKYVILYARCFLFTFLWSLLLIVPGIIKSLSYSMSLYIKRDRPELTAREAMCESERIMKGHKMELFILQLSFIGWALLSLLTCGLGFLLLAPYSYTTTAAYYETLKSELNE